ncbi:MAG: dihydrolipoyl dehydrogenase [Rhodocyclales bacterium]|nr:dihydrolipoyl dehydrogenase [Rhodocyclales bacterium]
MSKRFDLIVIGAGPGGYVAAIRAAQLGLSTAIVEREHLGGICLNWGCIPTKALLRSADVYRQMMHAADYGLHASGIGFDIPAMVKRSRDVSARLQSGVKQLLAKNKVTVLEGSGRLAGKGSVTVTPAQGTAQTLVAANVIIATGARPRLLPGLEPDGRLVWTYREAMTPQSLPKSLLVIGSGAIGIEFASFYRTLGSTVTVVEVLDRILPLEDEEISGLARKSFEKQGMTILTGATVKSLKRHADSVTAAIEAGGRMVESEFERVIVAVGTSANVENLGLEKTAVRIEKGRIATDEWCATAEPGVHAIGDVVAGPWLAHKASHEAILCVEHIAGLASAHLLDRERIPGCTYCHPQVASIGLTEQQARARGREVKVGRFPFVANGKAIAMGETEGLVKTVFDAGSGELLGAHMIGAEVTELIQGFALGKTLEATEAEFFATVFPHPTLSEAMHEAALSAFGRAIHYA